MIKEVRISYGHSPDYQYVQNYATGLSIGRANKSPLLPHRRYLHFIISVFTAIIAWIEFVKNFHCINLA